MEVVTVSLDRPDRWREALDGIPHGFGHTWESCHAMSLTSGAAVELFCHREPAGAAVCPFYERPFGAHVDIVTPYGFSGFATSGAPAGLESSWRELVARRGYVAGYIGLHPLFSPEGVFTSDRVVASEVHVLDLRPSEEQAMGRMSGNRRREVARWLRAPPRFDHPEEDLRAFVHRHFRDCHRRRGASDAYMLEDATLEALARSANVFLVGAGRGDALEAVSIFGFTRDEGQYLFNVSTDAGRSLTTPVLWEGRRRLRAMGVPRLNLGGGVRADGADGIAFYKSRFGGDRLALEALRQIYRPDVYDALCRRAGVDPGADGYFPAFRRPSSPV